jgi:diacylglycerol kinase family enzyme
MGGIGIITNPNSKMNKMVPTRGPLLGYIVGKFGKLEVTNSVDDLGRVASLFRDQGIEILGINGGDGTISRTLTAFIQAYGTRELPKILVLRGGTMNMLATNLGIRGTPEEILVRMLECQSGLRAKEVRSLATLSVGGQFGFLFGNALVARYLAEFYKNKSGAVGSLLQIFMIYFNWIFAPRRFRALVKSETYRVLFDGYDVLPQVHSLAMMASTVERMPLGAKLFPEAASSLSRFQFFSMEMSAGSLPWRLPFSLLRNRPGRFFGKVTRLASKVLISAENAQQPYTLDGELFEAPSGRLVLEVGPVVQFLVV